MVQDRQGAGNNVRGWNGRAFRNLYDLVYPVIHKVFPNFLPMKQKIEAIVPDCYVDPSIDTRPQDYKRD